MNQALSLLGLPPKRPEVKQSQPFVLFLVRTTKPQTSISVCLLINILDEECQDILQQQLKHKNSGNSSTIVYSQTSAVACFNEVIPVMQYICSRLEEARM